MNLGKLLGAGKSFISGGKPAAYRTDKRFYLPQFSSAKNPFAPGAATPVQAELPKPTVKKPAEQLMKKTATLPWAKTRKLPAVAAPTRTVGAVSWATKLNPVSLFRSAPAVDKAIATVQTELSLEKVKVVHNDLTDADVEVVPMKSRPAPELVPVNSLPPKRSWEVLGERIMKATAL